MVSDYTISHTYFKHYLGDPASWWRPCLPNSYYSCDTKRVSFQLFTKNTWVTKLQDCVAQDSTRWSSCFGFQNGGPRGLVWV